MRNDTTYQAPSLHHIGLKEQDNPTGQFYMLPQALAAIEERYGDTCGETQKILENFRATQVS